MIRGSASGKEREGRASQDGKGLYLNLVPFSTGMRGVILANALIWARFAVPH